MDSSRKAVARLVWPLLLTGTFLLISACGSGSSAGTNQAAQAEPDSDIVLPGPDGRFSDDTLVRCGSSPLFPASALKNPKLLAETTLVDPESFAPLAEFLASGEGGFWPQDGYRVLVNDAQSLLLAHRGSNGAVTLLGTALDGTEWMASALQSGAACPVQVPLRPGVHEVDWRIDPTAEVDAGTTTIALLATGRACSGGQAMGDRLQPPQTLLTDTAVYIVLVATELTGAQTCPGNPEEPVTVELGEPLGDREIIDGRTAAGLLSDYLPVSP